MIPTDQHAVVYDGSFAQGQALCQWAHALRPSKHPSIVLSPTGTLFVWLSFAVNMQTTPYGYSPCPVGDTIRFDPKTGTFTHANT